MTRNQINYWDLQEKKRYNTESLRETYRTNRANEDIKRQTNSNNLQIGLGNLAETNRSNVAKETEATRTNKENENIKRRANDINLYNASINDRNADTNARNAGTNAINASTNIGTLAEVMRHNQASEDLESRRVDETKRHQIAQENIDNFRAVTSGGHMANQDNVARDTLAETTRSHLFNEREIKRNNLVNQQIKTAELQQQINRDKFTTLSQLLSNMKPNVRMSLGGIR